MISCNCFVEPEQSQGPFYAKRVRHNNVIGPWKPCIKLKSDERKCKIRYIDDDKVKEIWKSDIASDDIPSHEDIEKLGTRIIAKHRKAYLPYTLDTNKKRVNLIGSRNHEFYSGIIARAYDDNKYCVFFDDGVVQMVERQHIRRVEENTFERGMCVSSFSYVHLL